MSLFLLLVVSPATCAIIWSEPIDPPPYAEAYKEIKVSENTLKEKILSMAENIPHLNDYRRHYAEITHVIYYTALVIAQRFRPIHYESNYQKLLNKAVAEAVTNPKEVIFITQKFIGDFNAKTISIQKLINICSSDINDGDCNEVIQNFTSNNPKTYAHEAEILLVGGEAAKIFNGNRNKFNYLSKEFEAHKYVIRQSRELKDLIYALSDVIRLVYPIF